jgi:hypothetical protein
MANYLYNGVEFPVLPKWDKATYPYAAIVHQTNNEDYKYYLFCSTHPFKYCVGTLRTWLYTDAPSNGLRYGTDYNGDEWVYESVYEDETGERICIAYPVYWANHDIYYHASTNEGTPGELYLAASDPIPVGSAPEVEPKSFMAGWRMGQIVRAMRG